MKRMTPTLANKDGCIAVVQSILVEPHTSMWGNVKDSRKCILNETVNGISL